MYNRMAVADEVLAGIEYFADGKDRDWSREAYCNGREQGYSVSGGYSKDYRPGMVSFSEFRNSDAIVVYVGKLGDFSMQGNVPSETVYTTGKHFFENPRDAARFIIGYLNHEEEE